MRKKSFLLFVILCCITILVACIFVACNPDSGEQTGQPGEGDGGEDETQFFTVTFDTQGGSKIADITVEDGQTIGELTLPTKQCSRLVEFALDADGERMWDVLTDTVSADITLYAIWEDAHDWGEWVVTTPATCTENGEKNRTCNACGKEETSNIPALGHDLTRFEYDDEVHWKICERCNGISEKTPHVYDESGKCECGAIEVTPDSEFTFAKLDDGTYSVTGYTGTRRYAGIPSAHDGAMVTSIGDYAFWGCSGLTSIAIPDSVTSIGSYAFSVCTGLTSVTIGNGVTSIGWDAFSGCSGLTSITIPDSVTSIGSSAFSGCTGLTSIYYTGDMQSWLGKDWHGLIMSSGRTLYINGNKVAGAIVIPDGITSIPSYAFAYQTDITSVTIPNSVTSIGSYAFSGCTAEIIWGDNPSIQQIGDHAFAGYAGTALAIPDNVTSIGEHAFDNCTGLKSVTIPDSVTSIGSSAFSGCSGLTSIAIPDSVTSIGWDAFSGCSGLTSVTIGNGVTSIGDYAFSGCYKLVEVYNKSKLNIVAGSSGNGYVAYYAKNVYTEEGGSRLTIDSGGFVFYYDGATGYLVGHTGNENELVLPDGFIAYNGVWVNTYEINGCAFYNCTGLTSIVIPDSVTSIGSSAFYGCSGLTSVYYTGDVAGWCGISGLDEVMSSGRTLYINGNKVAGAVVIPDGITSIPSYAFAYQTDITSVTIPNSVTSIGAYAFSGCSGLTSVTIGNGVTSIEAYAFSGCSGLTSITIPDGVTSIEAYAFSGCSGLTSITVAKNNAKYHSVENCLIEIATKTLVVGCKTSVIPDDGSVTSIGEGAFRGCTGLTSITIPDSVTIIGDSAFSDCSGLTSVTIGNGVTSIEAYAFYGCSGLTSITIPDSVTSIGVRAFYGCSSLTSATFENTSGWQVSSSSDFGSYTGLSSDILSNASLAATSLQLISFYWRRV